MSARSSRIGSSSRAISPGSCWPSPSTWTARSKPVLQRVLVTGLDRPADAEIERQLEHVRSRRLRNRGGAVGRAVVDHDELELRVGGADLGDHCRRSSRSSLYAGTITIRRSPTERWSLRSAHDRCGCLSHARCLRLAAVDEQAVNDSYAGKPSTPSDVVDRGVIGVERAADPLDRTTQAFLELDPRRPAKALLRLRGGRRAAARLRCPGAGAGVSSRTIGSPVQCVRGPARRSRRSRPPRRFRG